MTIKNILSAITILLLFHPPSHSAAAETSRRDNDHSTPEIVGELRDVVYLKNGSIIKGTIIEFIPDSTIRIQTADGSLFVYPAKDVERIVKEEIRPISRDSSRFEVASGPRARAIISPIIGYGTKDGYNLGLGLRIGATFSSGVYFGGMFVYHLGTSQDVAFNYGYSSTSYRLKYNVLYLGPEVGLEIRAAEKFSIRPYFSLGYFSIMAGAEGGGNSASASKGYFYVAPGLMFNIHASDRAIIGLDGRYVAVTGEKTDDAHSPAVFLSLGMVL